MLLLLVQNDFCTLENQQRLHVALQVSDRLIFGQSPLYCFKKRHFFSSSSLQLDSVITELPAFMLGSVRRSVVVKIDFNVPSHPSNLRR